jgi:hypothetical protein
MDFLNEVEYAATPDAGASRNATCPQVVARSL